MEKQDTNQKMEEYSGGIKRLTIGRIKKFVGDQEYVLRVECLLGTSKEEGSNWAKPPISLDFSVDYEFNFRFPCLLHLD